MRTISFLFCFLTAASAAGAQFTVSGNIKPAQEGQKLYFFSEDGSTRDSAVLKDGKFTFTTATQPKADDMFALILEGQPYPMLIVAEKPAIEVKGSAAKWPVAEFVKGGQQSAWMQEYHKAMEPILERVKALNAEAGTISGSNETRKEEFRKKAGAFEEDLKATGLNFVKTHPKAQASLFLLFGELRERLSREEFTELFNSLDASVKNTRFGQSIANDLRSAPEEAAAMGENAEAPDFVQNDPSGKPVKLSSFRGKYVLIDFWASWCGPCRQENPNVVEAYHKFKNKNFTILGVSLDKQKSAWEQAIKQDKLEWTQVSDLAGWGNAAAQLYRVQGIPQNFLIDPKGKIIAANLRGRALERKLAEVLK